ncbi:MAG: 2-hydroxyacyl-CoA dehydratase [Nitrospirae bacterium]|nr:2-hydroxyacyl-CoA dehydratase [Nitrospirota bacterium]
MSDSGFIRSACRKRYQEEIEALGSWRQSGRKCAGFTCNAFPPAVIAGLGIRPLRLLCGASSDAESAGERVARADVCPHVKCLLGNVSASASLHSTVDIWIGLYTCDQMRRGFQVLSANLGREVHPIQLPATRATESAEYYAGQVRRFVADAEAHHGLRFDPEAALAWHRQWAEAADALKAAALSPEISPLDLHEMFHLFFIARPFGLADFFKNLIANAPRFKPSRRVVLAGSPLAHEDTAVIARLEASGIGIVPLNCTGLNAVELPGGVIDEDYTPPLPRPFAGYAAGVPALGVIDEDHTPPLPPSLRGVAKPGGAGNRANTQVCPNDLKMELVGSLALQAFHLPPCIRARPNTPVYERIGRVIAETGASGLIVKCLKFCDQWYTERERMRRSFDIPVLVFDSDYAPGGMDRLESRIDAFIEMLP